MHRLRYDGIPLPEVYVCRSSAEARVVAEAGIPYVITRRGDEEIIKIILYRTLQKRFPHIKWELVLGIDRYESMVVEVPGCRVEGGAGAFDGDPMGRSVDIAEGERTFDSKGSEWDMKRVRLDAYCADAAAHVNIEQLQALHMLPKFMDDAVDAIRMNLEDRMLWRECWNKRLGSCIGEFDYSSEAPNLIILDVSGSIPDGISATMLELVDTLRDQANADLIITGSTSRYWSRDDELPDPELIRVKIGYANESREFFQILKKYVANRHFGNVISFGDNDAPFYGNERWFRGCMDGVEVDRVMHYHTFSGWARTGYARWCHEACPECEEVFDKSWCQVMRR